MIVKEKGLLRRMKEAYKSSGYNVMVDTVDGEEYLCLQHWGWIVGIQLVNVPRKVLGLLAEHMGRLPVWGEAFKVSKNQVQKEIFDVADDPFRDLLQCMDNWENHKIIKLTKLEWNGDQVWQCPKDLSIALVDPDVAALAAFGNNNDIRLEGINLMIKGSHSFAAVQKGYVPDGDKPLLSHLADMQWTE